MKNKICSICGDEKVLKEFKSKNIWTCIRCNKRRGRENYQRHREQYCEASSERQKIKRRIEREKNQGPEIDISVCLGCGEKKHPYRHSTGRVQWVCRPCRNKKARNWRKENPEEAAKISREYGRKNREKKPEKYLEAGRKYRQRHPERCLEYKKKCDQKYSEKRNKANRDYRKENFEKCSAHDKVKYAKKMGYLMQPKRCCGCKKENELLHAHHADYSRPLDVVWLCPDCHNTAHMLDRLRKESNSPEIPDN